MLLAGSFDRRVIDALTLSVHHVILPAIAWQSSHFLQDCRARLQTRFGLSAVITSSSKQSLFGEEQLINTGAIVHKVPTAA